MKYGKSFDATNLLKLGYGRLVDIPIGDGFSPLTVRTCLACGEPPLCEYSRSQGMIRFSCCGMREDIECEIRQGDDTGKINADLRMATKAWNFRVKYARVQFLMVFRQLEAMIK